MNVRECSARQFLLVTDAAGWRVLIGPVLRRRLVRQRENRGHNVELQPATQALKFLKQYSNLG